MVNAGRIFFMSTAGPKHTFEGFAEFLLELIKKD
jgi:hypothetical protein